MELREEIDAIKHQHRPIIAHPRFIWPFSELRCGKCFGVWPCFTIQTVRTLYTFFEEDR